MSSCLLPTLIHCHFLSSMVVSKPRTSHHLHLYGHEELVFILLPLNGMVLNHNYNVQPQELKRSLSLDLDLQPTSLGTALTLDYVASVRRRGEAVIED